MKKPVFTGAGVAIITPMYEDGSINFDELGRIIEDQIARHTDAIWPPSSSPWILSITAYRSLPVPVQTIPTTAAHWQQSLLPAVPMPC